MNDRQHKIIVQLDRLRDAIVHGRGYDSQEGVHYLNHAADMIEQMAARIEVMEGLISRNAELHTKAEKAVASLSKQLRHLKHERDAAVWDVTNSAPCFACKHFMRNGGTCHGGRVCDSDIIECESAGVEYMGPSWEWRGPCAENTEGE